MDKQSSTQAPWIPQTPVKPIAPIWPNTESNWNQTTEGNRLVGNMAGLDHLSFIDLLAMADRASFDFSSKTPWANKASPRIEEPPGNVVCGGPEMEMMQKANESLSSVSNIVAEQIKTPEKPKRKKHRPRVAKDAKPKRDPKPPQTPVADGQQSKTPRRKYSRKKEQVNKDQETSSHVKKRCRRALDFQDECFKPENQQPNADDTKHADETSRSKQCLTSAPSTPNRKQAAKRRQGKQPTRNIINPPGIQHNEQQMHWLYFTNLQQEGTMRSNARVDVSAFDSNCYSVTSHGFLTMEEKGKSSLDSTDAPIKKQTTGHARFRNLSSINKTLQASEQIPQKNKHNVLVDTPVTLSKKKRKTQTNQKTLLPASSAGSISPYELWNQRFSVEAITRDLCLLDINMENSETEMVPYSMYSQGNEIILFRGGIGAMVPFPPVKKRRPRPRVDIDDETDRVWKLLLEDINSSGIDGSDEEKTKWWKEERNVLEGRAHTFITRMHTVLGNRRFTAWKGSVVDSVVGVFLTQNVSDHLSSSAFMSLAAAFPAPSVPSTSFEAGTSSMPPPIQITYLDSEESISNPPVHNQGSVTLQPDEEKDYVNSEETSRSSSEITNPTKAQLDSDGTGSSVEVNKRDDETYNPFPSEDTERVGSNSVGEHHASFMKLLKGLEGQGRGVITVSVEESNHKSPYENSRQEVSPKASPGDCSSEVKDFKTSKGQTTRSSQDSNEPCCCSSSMPSTKHKEETSIPDINESTTSCIDFQPGTETPPADVKGKKALKENQEGFDWDSLRREAEGRHGKRERTTRTTDSVDWEAIRNANVSEVADTIKSRGMNNKLAERIQGFLDRLVTKHGSIDLEWLRDVPPDQAKEYLLSFRGLGLKSVECVRLLTLHHLAFPVDTNVGRIAVRLGWVPLQPLPESLQLHLLEMYPVLESIQKYLWPRLCKLDQKTLYELHYQMITFGKVFCTKNKPNCNACPMRAECRHFASAFASARLALPSTEKGIGTPDKNHSPLHLPEPLQGEQGLEVVKHSVPENTVTCCEPIVEVPSSPEPQRLQITIADIEDSFFEDPEEIPDVKLDMSALTSNLKKIMELQDGNMSTALVALTEEAASIPMPKLKNISQLRTEHQVYELPDSHPLLDGLEKREPDDPCSYLLAIWTPGETADSVQPAMSRCVVQEMGKLCDEETCFSCNNIKEARSQTVRGTILIPCRTAMRGSFPLNGTYFQVNEVFADHDSSLKPIDVPRELIWDLRRKTVYFGTSVPTIFKGLPMETIRQCFWKGYVCVRGFDRKTRGPKPLIARLHFPASKMSKSQDKPSNPQGA